METDNIKLAKTIDFINSLAIKYYTRDTNKMPDPYKLEEELLKEHGIDHKYFDHAIRIMKLEELIIFISNDDQDNKIRELRHTDKGLLLYLNGGMTTRVKREKNKADLVTIAQVAAILGGIHYLFENFGHLRDFFHCH